MRVLRLSFVLAAACLRGQTLDVYSEFVEVDPFGDVAPAGGAAPREILSPAVARGAYASYLAVVRSPRTNYFLFLGVNPAESVRASLYKVDFTRVGDRWIPDALRPAEPPNFGVIPDPEAQIPGQSARVYLLDVWVPPDATPGRIRVEVQLKAGSWTIWPMEMRILPAVVPAHGRSAAPLPDLGRPPADAVLAPLEGWLAKPSSRSAAPSRSSPLSLRDAIRRNAEQDLALAGPGLVPAVREKFAARKPGSEWYLPIRDLILRSAGEAR
jgi:hypothetical protein